MKNNKLLSCLAIAASISMMTACTAQETASAPTPTAAETTTAAQTTTAEQTTTTAQETEASTSETTTASSAEEIEAAIIDEGSASVSDITSVWFEDALDARTLTIKDDGTFTLEYKGGGSRYGTVKIDYEESGDGSKRAWYSLCEDEDVWISFPEDENGEQLLDIWAYEEGEQIHFRRDIAIRDEGNNMDPVDLKSLTRDTDIRSLSNAEAHRFDEGELAVDLDGDGTDEILDFSHTTVKTLFDDEEITERAFCINGTELKAVANGSADVFAGDFSAVDSYSDYFYICDIDSSDNFKEIAFVPCSFTNEYSTFFYRYDNGTLQFIGDIVYDVPDSAIEDFDNQLGGIYLTDNNPLVTDGSSVITAAVRCDALQTWFGYSYYYYDDTKGQIVPMEDIEVFPYGYDLKDDYEKVFSLVKDFIADDSCELLREIEVYKEHDEESEHFTMQPQPACLTGVLYHEYDWEQNDYDWWVYITAKDGSGGWIHITEYPDYENPLFSGLTLYD